LSSSAEIAFQPLASIRAGVREKWERSSRNPPESAAAKSRGIAWRSPPLVNACRTISGSSAQTSSGMVGRTFAV
jgi:hypothetical protein